MTPVMEKPPFSQKGGFSFGRQITPQRAITTRVFDPFQTALRIEADTYEMQIGRRFLADEAGATAIEDG